MGTVYNNAVFILISLGYMGIPEEVGWIILAGLITPLQAVERNLWQLFDVRSFCRMDSKLLNQVWEMAAKNGRLQILKKLHYNGVKYTAAAMMDLAAENGHLEIVKFLHENRKEGCTTRVMDCAAENGYLKIVKFLHENRNEGCIQKMQWIWRQKVVTWKLLGFCTKITKCVHRGR